MIDDLSIDRRSTHRINDSTSIHRCIDRCIDDHRVIRCVGVEMLQSMLRSSFIDP